MTRLSPPTDPQQIIDEQAHGLSGTPRDYDWLLDQIGERPIVLLGEASHGTHEFYRERIRITQRLIGEKGFNAVAVEADWPDAYRVNRFVRGVGDDADATDALAGFKRFPTWMWRNADVVDCGGSRLPRPGRLCRSASRPRAVCMFRPLSRRWPRLCVPCCIGRSESCERQAIEQLTELQKRTEEHAVNPGRRAARKYCRAVGERAPGDFSLRGLNLDAPVLRVPSARRQLPRSPVTPGRDQARSRISGGARAHGAMRTTENAAVFLHAVPDHPAPAMGASRSERLDRAFEAVEDVWLVLHDDLERLVVSVPTNLAWYGRHGPDTSAAQLA